MRIGCMTFRSRKEKSAVVMTLADTNFPVESDNGNRIIIGDISWCDKKPKKTKPKATTALMIEFLYPEQANKAIANDSYWQGERHACNIADRRQSGLQRCLDCQQYGHLSQTCSAEPRCGKCAGQHQEENCTSTELKCVLCGGPHYSAGPRCLVKEQAKKSHGFPTTRFSLATDLMAEVQVAIKMEPNDQLESVFGRTQRGYSIPETLHQRNDDYRIVAIAREIGFQPDISVELKREAEDAMPEGESDGDAKRIKQEDLEQEDPPYHEDSMPPYRQRSPYMIHRPD